MDALGKLGEHERSVWVAWGKADYNNFPYRPSTNCNTIYQQLAVICHDIIHHSKALWRNVEQWEKPLTL